MNYDNEIESFINFCGDMQISNEGFNLSGVWIGIKNVFKKIITFFKNLLYNINYFKNAKMPRLMHKDLQLVLQNLTPRFEMITSVLNLMYKLIKLDKDNSYYENELKDFNNMIDLYDSDADDTLQKCKESKEYKRIMNNDYEQKDVVTIPLNAIINKIKDSEKNITDYNGKYESVVNNMNHAKSDEDRKIYNKMSNVFRKLVSVYSLQVTLLNIYFSKAKASLKAVGNNLKEIKDKSVNVSRDYDGAKRSFIKNLLRRSKRKYIKNTPEFLSKFKEINNRISETNNDITKYNEYRKAFDELASLVNESGDQVIIYPSMINESCDTFQFFCIKEDGKPFTLLDNMQLYHTSNNPNLKELVGRYFHTSNGYRRLWATPRVYFSIGTAISRDGSKFDEKTKLDPTDIMRKATLTKYTPAKAITQCYRDEEIGGNAVFVTTTSAISIKKC